MLSTSARALSASSLRDSTSPVSSAASVIASASAAAESGNSLAGSHSVTPSAGASRSASSVTSSVTSAGTSSGFESADGTGDAPSFGVSTVFWLMWQIGQFTINRGIYTVYGAGQRHFNPSGRCIYKYQAGVATPSCARTVPLVQ